VASAGSPWAFARPGRAPLLLAQCFAGRYSTLVFRRRGHTKAAQGRVTAGNLAFAVRFVLRSTLRLLAQRPRVLYVDVPKDAPSFVRTSPILLVALALRIRVVGDLAGADFQFLGTHSLPGRYGSWLLPRLARIRVLGEHVAATLERRGLGNAVVVPNGIAEPPGAPVDGRSAEAWSERRACLYVGKIAEAKGIFTLLDFVAAARGRDEDVHLHVVGEWESDDLRQRVLQVVDANGLQPHVEFHGLLVDAAKWAVFDAAHVLVHPTTWDGQPVTILEALAVGLPVVATQVGAIPDTVRSGVEGYLMADGSAEEVAAGVAAVTSDRETYAAYSRRARQSYLDRFTLARFESAMGDLLDAEAT